MILHINVQAILHGLLFGFLVFFFKSNYRSCGDTTKCTSMTIFCGNANVTRYFVSLCTCTF